MAQKTADFEKGTAGATIATGDAGSADAWQNVQIPGGSSIIYSASPAFGRLAAKIDGGAGTSPLLEWAVSMGATHHGQAYIFPTVVQAGKIIAPIQAGVAYRGSISINAGAGNKFDLNDAAGTSDATSNLSLLPNQFTRLAWKFIQSATVGQIELKIWIGMNVDGPTPDEIVTTSAALNLGTTVDTFQFGHLDSSTGVTWWDDIVAGAASAVGSVHALPKALSTDYCKFPKQILRRLAA